MTVCIIAHNHRKDKIMATKKVAEATTMLGVEVPDIQIDYLDLKIIGDSPLIVHKWSTKARRQILRKQMKKNTEAKEPKDPEMDFYESLYWLNFKEKGDDYEPTKEEYVEALRSGEARFGFPSVGLKACAVDAGYQQGILSKKTTARGAFHTVDEFIEIKGTPTMREDMVKITGTSDIRFRGEFREWWAVVRFRYNKAAISPDQIIALVNMGGFANGIGEWRPEKDGTHGTFHVACDGE